MIKIEKGVPVADARVKYPFADMEVGDSFWIGGLQDPNAPRGAAFRWGSNHGVSFKTRKEKDGVRVWRVA